MIKISLVDDKPEDRASLISLVQEIFQNKNITFSYDEFESAEDFLASYESGLYDLCFLDIYMKNMNGMDAAREIRKLDPDLAIVFLTSSPDYVYEGYEVQALRYLMKPPAPEKVQIIISDLLHQTPLSLVHAVILAARTVVGWSGDGINSLSSGYSSDMKKRLIEAKTRDVKPFCSSLTSINRLYNTPHQIIADKEALYIAPI